LAARNAFDGFEVVGVEEPFVLSLGDSLPPCVGVVDLILRRAKTFFVVDPKTGKKFNGADELQLILYREYVRRQYRAVRCLAFVDEYRWVPNLDKVRKPAFQRRQIRLGRTAWSQATRRMARAYSRIREIEKNPDAWRSEKCYLCPEKSSCPKASVGYSGYWS
jgi:CRISPR/Cas system-associated exonuclease Cas4 (RecB family)